MGAKAFFHYFNEKKLGNSELALMIAAYAFERKSKLDFITEDGLELTLRSIYGTAIKSGYPYKTIQSLLVDEFNQYKSLSGPFAREQDEGQSSFDWWREHRDLGIIRKVGMRSSSLKSSSANVERVFSILKLIQGPVRTRFSLYTLENIARVKVSMIENDDLELMSIFTDSKLSDEYIDLEVGAQASSRGPNKSVVQRMRSAAGKLLKRTIASSSSSQESDSSIIGFQQGDSSASGSQRRDGSVNSQRTNRNRSPQVDLLPSRLRDNYLKFIKLIDFNIINQPSGIVPGDSSSEDDSFSSILGKYRGLNASTSRDSY